MKIQQINLTEAANGAKVIAVYAGGFQPFHQGHMSSYLQLKKALPSADIYVAASNDTKTRPIPFEDKNFLAQQAGVSGGLVQVRIPMNPTEILAKYNPEKDIFVLVRSERDPVTYTKKDGSPGYFQPLVDISKCEPFAKHGYVFVTKKHTFQVNGVDIYSGTQVRTMYSEANSEGRAKIVAQLYPHATNPKKIQIIFDKYLTVQESITEDNSNKKPHLYLDMDGVQADFFAAWAAEEGVSSWREITDNEQSIWRLSKKGPEYVENFFANLDQLQGGRRIVSWCHEHHIPFTVLSAPLRGENKASIIGKKIWLDKYVPGSSATAIFTTNKYKYATAGGQPNVLVDDYGKYIDQWSGHGGIPIKHEDINTEATIARLEEIYLDKSDTATEDISESMLDEMSAFHGSFRPRIGKFKPFSHFGSEQAANDRLKFLTVHDTRFKGQTTGYLYKLDLGINSPATVKDYPKLQDPSTGRMDKIVAWVNDLVKDPRVKSYVWNYKDTQGRPQQKTGVDRLKGIQYSAKNGYWREWESPAVFLGRFIQALRDMGIDGFVYKNQVEHKGELSYIAFDPDSVRVMGRAKPVDLSLVTTNNTTKTKPIESVDMVEGETVDIRRSAGGTAELYSRVGRELKIHARELGKTGMEHGNLLTKINGLELREIDKQSEKFVYLWDKEKNVPAGYFMFSKEDKAWHPDYSFVSPKYAGGGVGLRSYVTLIKKGMMLRSGHQQSTGGQKLWNELSDTPGVFVFGVRKVNGKWDYTHVEPGAGGQALGDFGLYSDEDSDSKLIDKTEELLDHADAIGSSVGGQLFIKREEIRSSGSFRTKFFVKKVEITKNGKTIPIPPAATKKMGEIADKLNKLYQEEDAAAAAFLVAISAKQAPLAKESVVKKKWSPLELAIMEGGHSLGESINEGGWASVETQDTVITPGIVKEIDESLLPKFETEYNKWAETHRLNTIINMGKPCGSATYYKRDLLSDPLKEYGDVDVNCFIEHDSTKTGAQRVAEYREAIQEFCKSSGKYRTNNGTNITVDTSAGPIQVDLVLSYVSNKDWSRALAPEHKIKGVVSTSLTSSLAKAINLSYSSHGVQVKLRAGVPVDFLQKKDTKLFTITNKPDTWGQDIYRFFFKLVNGKDPKEMPSGLVEHPGLKDEQRNQDIINVIGALATAFEEAGLYGTEALAVPNRAALIKDISKTFFEKITLAINSSKFEKAASNAAIQKAEKTKSQLTQWRDQYTKLLLQA